MLTVSEALERVLAHIPRLDVETVSLFDAHGRVLAHDVVSPVDVPPWDNSAMDGYAVRAADTDEGEVVLTLLEVVGAGGVAEVPVGPGQAIGIMTGAPTPGGADAVVMVEQTDAAQTGQVRVRGRARVGDHIRRRGEDITLGATVLRAGQTLTPAQVGLLASLGQPEVDVVRKPVVAILTTGDEVVMPGQPLGPGQIYSSNGVSLAGLVIEAGGVPRLMGNAPDRLEELVAFLQACLDADLVVTTGGVSVGVYDYVKEAFERLGAQVDFWKVALKPGKPLAYGLVTHHDRTVPIFGLPGNPVSCMVNFLEFVRPVLRQALGDPRPFLPVVTARIEVDHPSRPGRTRLDRVILADGPQGWTCRPTGTQSSGVLTSMARAHGLLVIPPDVAGYAAGDVVQVQVIDPGFLAADDPRW